MSADRRDTHEATDSAAPIESNGTPPHLPGALCREIVMLRVRCANLRHSSQALFDEAAASAILDATARAELLATAPAIGETEAHELLMELARGGSVPANHLLAPTTTDVNQLRVLAAALTAEHERLRQAFFTLYDHIYPNDNLTEEYFLAQKWEAISITDVLAEIEREFAE